MARTLGRRQVTRELALTNKYTCIQCVKVIEAAVGQETGRRALDQAGKVNKGSLFVCLAVVLPTIRLLAVCSQRTWLASHGKIPDAPSIDG